MLKISLRDVHVKYPRHNPQIIFSSSAGITSIGLKSARPILGRPDWLAAVSTAKSMNARGSQTAARMSGQCSPIPPKNTGASIPPVLAARLVRLGRFQITRVKSCMPRTQLESFWRCRDERGAGCQSAVHAVHNSAVGSMSVGNGFDWHDGAPSLRSVMFDSTPLKLKPMPPLHPTCAWEASWVLRPAS